MQNTAANRQAQSGKFAARTLVNVGDSAILNDILRNSKMISTTSPTTVCDNAVWRVPDLTDVANSQTSSSLALLQIQASLTPQVCG